MLSSSRKMPTTSAPQIPFRLPTPPSGCTRSSCAASRPRASRPSEPPRLSRRRSRWAFHAAMAVFSSGRWWRAPAAAGGTGPMGPRSRRRRSSRCARSLLRADLRLGGGEPHRLEAAPGAPPADRLGLEEPDHGLGRRGVERAPRPAPPDLRPRRARRRPRRGAPRAGWRGAGRPRPSARPAPRARRGQAQVGGLLERARPWPRRTSKARARARLLDRRTGRCAARPRAGLPGRRAAPGPVAKPPERAPFRAALRAARPSSHGSATADQQARAGDAPPMETRPGRAGRARPRGCDARPRG